MIVLVTCDVKENINIQVLSHCDIRYVNTYPTVYIRKGSWESEIKDYKCSLFKSLWPQKCFCLLRSLLTNLKKTKYICVG